jgi:hypothetical protein
MSESVKKSASTSVFVTEWEPRVLFAANDALEMLLSPESARQFDQLRFSLREATAPRGTEQRPLQRRSLSPAAARLADATTYYEQRVLAWYALGRVREARAAAAAIARCREALAAETGATRTRTGPREADQMAVASPAATRPVPHRAACAPDGLVAIST